MPQPFVRIEGSISQADKDRLDILSLEMRLPKNILVGNSVSLWIAQHEISAIGSQDLNLDICTRKLDAFCIHLDNIHARKGPELESLVRKCAVYFVNSYTNHKKKEQIHESNFRQSMIEDIMKCLIEIKGLNELLFNELVHILLKSTKGVDKSYILELSERLEVPGAPYYTGSTHDTSIYDDIALIASNCFTGPKNLRAEKRENALKYISENYDVNDVGDLISVFQIAYEKYEKESDIETEQWIKEKRTHS